MSEEQIIKIQSYPPTPPIPFAFFNSKNCTVLVQPLSGMMKIGGVQITAVLGVIYGRVLVIGAVYGTSVQWPQ